MVPKCAKLPIPAGGMKGQFKKFKLFGGGKGKGRRMKFPYTLTARIAQFPYMFYFRNNYLWEYYAYALVLSAPVFMWLQRVACSEANKKTWADTLKRWKEQEHEEHEKYLK